MNFDFLILLTVEQLVCISAFVLFFIIQVVYYCTVFARVAFYKSKKTDLTNVSQEGVSIVICIRNESEKLDALLPKILEQGHPEFEVVIINNCSTDDSDDVLNLLKVKYANLVVRTIELDEVFAHNNAMAWGVGFKAARYEWIVLTDINCYLENGNWLAALQKNFNKSTDIVLSYTQTEHNKFARADNFFDALNYLSKACAGKPYTGSGTNMAFRKSLFFNNRGFHPLLTLHDKADRVFVNTVAKRANTAVELTSEAINASSLKLSFKWWRLKRRDELRTQRLFEHAKFAGCFEQVSRAIFYILFVTALILLLNVQWAYITILLLFVARLFLQVIIFTKAQKRLKEKGLLLTSLCWDILSLIVYIPVIILSKRERR